MSASVLWAGTPDDDGDDAGEPEVEGALDQTFAARRLSRWLKGMFGGPAKEPAGEGNQEVPPPKDP